MWYLRIRSWFGHPPPGFPSPRKLAKNDNIHLREPALFLRVVTMVTTDSQVRLCYWYFVAMFVLFLALLHVVCPMVLMHLSSMNHNELHSFLVGDICCRTITCKYNVDSFDIFGAHMGLATSSLFWPLVLP